MNLMRLKHNKENKCLKLKGLKVKRKCSQIEN